MVREEVRFRNELGQDRLVTEIDAYTSIIIRHFYIIKRAQK